MISEASKRLIRECVAELRRQAQASVENAQRERKTEAWHANEAVNAEADAAALNAQADELEADLVEPPPAPVALTEPEPEHVEPAPETAG